MEKNVKYSIPFSHNYFTFFLNIILIFWVISGCKNDGGGDDKTEGIPVLYQELYRPQFHFSPTRKWMNDPNGLVYYEEEYHLFYQYYPDSTIWGPMHWGHAVSTDLVYWQHLPIALYPDSLGYIFSGSAVVDWNNTSGFGAGGSPPLVAIFTHHDPEAAKAGKTEVESQSIAYSNDKGRSWTKFQGNPVIKNPGIRDFRDPKVMWYEKGSYWVLALAAKDRLHIYTSPDLKSWTFASEFGSGDGNHDGVWECPDLFPLEFEGEEKWVLIQNINPGHPHGGSGTQYFIGEFDGKTFVNDNPPGTTLWLDWGRDNYAGVTWFNAPSDRSKTQKTFIGWMSNWEYAQQVPTAPWRSAMTLPRTLALAKTKNGFRLSSIPFSRLTAIRKEAVAISRGNHSTPFDFLKNVQEKQGLYEMIVEFEKPDSGKIELEIFNSLGNLLYVGYDADLNEYYVDRLSAGDASFSPNFAGKHIAPREADDPTIKMHLFIDVASIELFSDNGLTVMTEIFFPSEPFTDIRLNPQGQTVTMTSGRVFTLQSIW